MARPKIGAFKIGTQPKQILSEDPKRKHLKVYNAGASGTAMIELLSTQHQKYGDGVPIPPASAPYENDYCQGAYWLVAASGEQDVRIEEDVEE